MTLPHDVAFWTVLPVAIATGLVLALIVNRRAVRRPEGSGDPRAGTVVFVEPVRWWFIVWGFVHVARGLRRAGYAGRIRLFRWSNRAGSLLVLPDLMRRGRLKRKAARLAELLLACRREQPDAPLDVIAYSSGCYIAVEACRRADPPPLVGTLVLLAGTISPRYRLDPLEGRVPRLVNVYGPLDWINLVGPALFGSNDRRWGPACGAVGFRGAPDFVEQRKWRPADVRFGYWGGHFSVVAPAFIAQAVAPGIVRPSAADGGTPGGAAAPNE
jgi:hypothetical protein